MKAGKYVDTKDLRNMNLFTSQCVVTAVPRLDERLACWLIDHFAGIVTNGEGLLTYHACVLQLQLKENFAMVRRSVVIKLKFYHKCSLIMVSIMLERIA